MPDPTRATISATQTPALFRGRFQVSDTGCWLWIGAKTSGYGELTVEQKVWRAHRLMWILVYGEIPQGLELDHLCRDRACINPAHLEPVTHRENILRGETIQAAFAKRDRCKNGHVFTVDNIARVSSRPHVRICRECRRIGLRRWYAKHGKTYREKNKRYA